MLLAHKIRLNPTPEQETYFRRAAGVARLAFNWGLAEWKRQYEAGQKPSALGLKAQFNAIKREQFPFVTEVTKCATEQAFTDLGKAFANYFRRVKQKAAKKGYPRFKSKKRSTPSFYLANDKFKAEGHWLQVPRLGWVNMAEPLRFEGKIMGARIRYQGGRWYVAIQVEVEREEAAWNGLQPVGIDVGINRLMTLSSGVEAENQRITRLHERRLRQLNKKLSRQVKGSNNWWKTKRKLGTLHATIRNQRQDYLHKWTTWIASQHGVIGLETLNTAGLLKNRRLAKHIADAAFGEIGRMLEYKQQLHGSHVVWIGQFFPSTRLCSGCGWKHEAITLAERVFACQACGLVIDRDLNAAINIEREALRIAYDNPSSGTG
jgi:putative transposase